LGQFVFEGVQVINWFHAQFHCPEKGWDPITDTHAREYAESEWSLFDERVLDEIEPWVGGFVKKSVLDLGGGPGQFSVAMAKRGALVTWYDVSRRYQLIAQKKAKAYGVSLLWSLGYLDDASKLGEAQFDLVFNRICWNYARSDKRFAGLIWNLLKPNGVAYIDANNDTFKYELLGLSSRLRTRINARYGWKVGHPMPPRGRIAELFNRLPIERMAVDYTLPTNDRLLFLKKG
jgi:SAM-dependent methyltransferase